jgi:hypothetical protein
MTLRVRGLLLGTVACAATVVCVGMALVVPAAQAAIPFGVEKFVAANCKVGHETCGEETIEVPLPPPFPPFIYSFPKEPNLTEAREAGYTQAAGHPVVGITAFKVNTEGTFPNAAPAGVATGGIVTKVRTDVAPGVSTNPEAVKKCTMAEFEGHEVAPGAFTAPTCSAETEIGINKVVVWGGPKAFPEGGDFPVEGKVYNVVQPNGLASLFAVALDLKNVGHPGVFAHTLIEGHIEWAGDYHDYYEINVSPTIPLIASRLSLFGNKGNTGHGGFITNPSRCEGPGHLTTNEAKLKPLAGPEASRTYIAPLGPEGCLGESPFMAPPFAPTLEVKPERTQSDQPTGVTAELAVPHSTLPTELDSSQLRTASVALPEGMTLNPSAAPALKACTPAQIGIGTRNPVACPPESRLGTVTLTVPDLPETEPLIGNIYLGGTEPITGGPAAQPEYTIYIDAESARYEISVRLQGTVKPDPATGRVTTVFADNPEQPFSNISLSFKGGALAPIANPLVCGPAKTETSLIPYTGTATKSPFSEFVVDSNGKGAACPSPLPFTLAQSTVSAPTTAGANTNFTFNLSRADGQQYLSRVSTTLPPGLVGKIPAVPLCPEPQASLGTCSSASQIGAAVTTVGSGPTPIQFSGPVFLTGPTGKAPYGMTTVVNAAVGPFSLGNVIVRTGIEVDPITARITVAGNVPTIVKGIPLRMKTLSVAINRQGFLINPTNCGALTVNTTLTSTLGAMQTLSSPFQATGCSSLAFKPKFSASSNGKTSRANGAALNTKISYPSGLQANIKSVLVKLPKQLPSRLSTLKNACREAVFNANPFSCPSNSRVGGATVKTPVLPEKLTGPAFFVSHGGAAFPDLDFVLHGNGITVIMVGNTNISKGITSSNFAAIPDVPVTSFEANLPVGRNSAVTANGSLCKKSLVMPTTITAQNGKVIKQNTPISVSGCPVTVISSHTRGNRAIVTVRAPAAGRVSSGGANLKTVYRHVGKAQNVTLEAPLTSSSRPLAVRVRIGFIPKKKAPSSVAHTTVLFK